MDDTAERSTIVSLENITASIGSDRDFLNALWAEIDVNNLKCCHCDSQIDLSYGLARTFCLRSHCTESQLRFRSEIIEVPTLNDQLILYHRHLECLFQSTEYIAISHVWHTDVADFQYKKEKSTVQVGDVARIIRDVPARVCQGLMKGLGKRFEIWCDYISVPQWQDDAKLGLVEAIPQIFEGAVLTTAYLSDLDAASINAMRKGSSVLERSRGISSICNAKWFSRVWTAMEYTQSHRIHFMTRDFVLWIKAVHDRSEHNNLFKEIELKWSAEVGREGSAFTVEAMVGMGFNLVPWQLGSLKLVRSHNKNGTRISFAIAHELLARRCVTDPRDFLYGLLGILKTGQTVKDLNEDMSEALLEVARSCLKNGDLSPLFMVPAAAQGLVDEKRIQSYGYNDLDTFALGPEEKMPRYSEVKISSRNPIIKAERIGTIRRIFRDKWDGYARTRFLILVRLTMEVTGVEVDSFVETLGGRLYGQETKKIFDRLSEEGRRNLLESRLSILRDTWFDPEQTFSLILGKNPVLCVQKHQRNSSGQYTVNLAEYLGNNDGKFSMDGNNFHWSAQAIGLDGTVLTAQLRTVDGQWQTDKIDVRAFVIGWSKETKNQTFSLLLGENPVLCVQKHQTGSPSQHAVNLSEYLGNDNGKFSMNENNFHRSARAIRLDGTVLTAQLMTRDGKKWQTDKIDVGNFVTSWSKETEKHLDLIADAMGLSNRALDSKATPLSPMEFLNSHGNTIHFGFQSAIVSASCPSCRQEFLIRTALFFNESQAAGSTIWRIPGLKYEFSLEGGAGFILNNDRIVGRFLWASQTCDCTKLENIEVLLHKLPAPRQNKFKYGSLQNKGWIALDQRMKFEDIVV